MITAGSAAPPSVTAQMPTVWGLDPVQLHHRFWAARGVQVVRQGERSAIVQQAELFLLTNADFLTIFKIGRLVHQLSWLSPDLMLIRLHESRDHGYREHVVTDRHGEFVRFNRIYVGSEARLARVALTPSRRIAEIWQAAKSPRAGWRELRRRIPTGRRTTVSVDGNVYDQNAPQEVMQCMRDLIQVWRTPDATISRARRIGPGVWGDNQTDMDPTVQFIGPAWVGAGRRELSENNVIGPTVLWDDPEHRPESDSLEWLEIEPSPVFERSVKVQQTSQLRRVSKRIFDIIFAMMIMPLILPLFPIIMLAIWIEDGRPIFYGHRRETLGGREFDCIKFRSMRNDADKIKAALATQNQADGPQFFIDPEDDPRLTRTGKLIRKLNLDELPQFFNVLTGDMSIVGPRPSPRAENQCCPPWREARLSVRPGITGLWQVMRTRQVGMDFQEWIKYDIEYVENASWRMDLYIIIKTILIILKLSK
ncbi:sugar transferase [Planctomycetales bacterium ZRK34]|nr:sugar transferase [Planctomycetales bacterium ZRK34]